MSYGRYHTTGNTSLLETQPANSIKGKALDESITTKDIGSIQSRLDRLDRDFCHLVIFGIQNEDIIKVERLVSEQGLTILEESTFGHGRPQPDNLVDLFLKLPPCSIRDLIMDLSAAGIRGRFQGYNRRGGGAKTDNRQDALPVDEVGSSQRDGRASE